MISQKLNQRQARWALYLLYFNFILKHVPEKSMGKADGLSQRADQQEGVENDNKDRMLIKQEQIKEVEILVENGNLREKIKKAQEKDKKVVKVIKELKKVRMKNLKDKEQAIEKEIVMKEGYIYILEGNLRRKIIHLHHNTLVGGHGRR